MSHICPQNPHTFHFARSYCYHRTIRRCRSHNHLSSTKLTDQVNAPIRTPRSEHHITSRHIRGEENMANSLHFSHQPPSPTDPTTQACYNLALQTFASVPSFDPPSWQRRLEAEGARLFTASSSSDPNPTSHSTPDRTETVHGFLLTSLRQHPELSSPTFHISLAAVDIPYRGLGIFPRLLALVEAYCRDELGVAGSVVTICTLPEKFPGMWRVLSDGRNGWVEVGWRETGDGRQVLMRRGV